MTSDPDRLPWGKKNLQSILGDENLSEALEKLDQGAVIISQPIERKTYERKDGVPSVVRALVEMNKGKKKMKMHDALEVVKIIRELIKEDVVSASDYGFMRFLCRPANEALKASGKRLSVQDRPGRAGIAITQKKN